ncbi:MAG: iron-sulfur cluster assembly scaffold protein [Candidatus Uhrbacteria bacterium]|nr:iron-sulfur cluster assembly scaffold protein [Candidatus Uhrbacteria bacterium]
MDIYSEILLDHYNYPHHAGTLKKPTVRVVKNNPLCGDTLGVDIAISKNNTLGDIAFSGSGCALSQAGMSLLAEHSIGKPLDELEAMTSDTMDTLLGTRVSPGRRTCADLGMSAVKEALGTIRKNKPKGK